MHAAPISLRPSRLARSAVLLMALAAAGAAHAVQDCELNGESVNPNNGNSTKGKTGLMRCKDGDTGQILREQELRNGEYEGIFRFYQDGRLLKEHSVNARGNQHGRAREFARDGKTVVSDAIYDNGERVGVSRSWYETGEPRRATFYENRQERASVEWNKAGQLQDLRCHDRPVLAPAFDDRRPCGFAGDAEVLLYSGSGELQSRLVLREGRRAKTEHYGRNGKPQVQIEIGEGSRVERRFAEDGVKRRELRFAASGPENRLYKTLEQEFSERGTLVREQRWGERGAALSDVRYYLNGQPREKSEYISENGVEQRIDTSFYDTGRVASEGRFLEQRGRYRGEPVGTHKRFDEAGRVVAESIYDARGRLTREKAWDDTGAVVRDDEVFEDGSRKAFSR